MKDIKEKPAGRIPKSNVTGKIPKAALKKAWTEAKEKSRTKLRENTAAQGDGDYTTAQDTGAMLANTSYSATRISPYSKAASRPASRFRNTGNSAPQSRVKPPAPTPLVNAVSAPNRLGAARCPMWISTRAVGQIFPSSGRKKKSSLPKLRHAAFAA